MVHKLLDLVAPHYCCSCGEIGSLLCESCKYDIVSERFSGCLLCGKNKVGANCKSCTSGIERTWCAGERTGALETLINSYKFENAEAAYMPLGDLLLASLPELPPDTIIIPIPTVRAHIRQRGYDHTLLLARYVAAKQGVAYNQYLRRKTASVQRGASRTLRIAQAKAAFEVKGYLDPSLPYLLLDDVSTTGSTLRYAAKALKNAGATTIWAAAIARQPLD